MHPLLDGPRTAVNLALVEDFLSLKLPEGLTVEYKRGGDKPAVAVAALANTYGGLLLVGVAEDAQDKGVPAEIVGVSRKEKEQLVNQMATGFDPPWSPEVIEVPLGDDKVVLVVRVDRDIAPRPIVYDGSIYVRLDGRNVKANRQMMRMLLDEPAAIQQDARPATASRSPHQHEPAFHMGINDPDVVLRAVTSMRLWRGGERPRVPSGLANKVVRLMDQTNAAQLLGTLGSNIRDGAPVGLTPWMLTQATSRRVRLTKAMFAPIDGSFPDRPGVQMDCTVSLQGTGPAPTLEVLLDTSCWLPDEMPLGLWAFEQVLQDSVPIVANTLLPAVAEAVTGMTAFPTPAVEVHVAARRQDTSPSGLETLLALDRLGPRAGGDRIDHGSEVLLRGLVTPPDWSAAVREALVVMAMDWGFPAPEFD